MSSQYVKLGDRSLDQWKVTELREELKRRQLATKGLKEELLRRLDEAIRNERENSAESVENDEHDENDANQSELPFEEAKAESDISGGTKDFMDVGISMDEKADAKPEHETDDHMSLFEGNVEVSLEQGTKIAELEGAHNAQIAAVETTVVINETVDTATKVSGQPLDNDGIHEDGDSTAVSNNYGFSHVQEDAKLELCDPETQLPMNPEGSTPVVPSGEPNLEDSGTQDEALHSTDQMETDDPKHLHPDSNVQPLKYQVSEVVDPDLGFQVTSDFVSTQSVSIFEKNELKVDVITENVQLELDAMNEMAHQLPSSVLPDGGESHPLDVEEPVNKKYIEEPLGKIDVQEPLNKIDVEEPLDNKDAGRPLHNKDAEEPLDENNVEEPLGNKDVEESLDEKDFEEPLDRKDVEEIFDKKDVEETKIEASGASNVEMVDSPKNIDREDMVPENLNLDRSSGDDFMEEDIVEGKPIEFKSDSSNIGDNVEKSGRRTLEEEDHVDVVGQDKPVEAKPTNSEKETISALTSVKRKFHDIPDKAAVVNNDPVKKARKWNAEGLKGSEPQSGTTLVSTTPKDLSKPTFKAFSGIRPAVNDEAPKERIVPPSSKPPTNSLRIDRFLRPFTLKQVQELLGKTGTVAGFWMDHIKTHCYVSYSSVEEAVETRNAVYNLQWPSNGGRLLVAEFVDSQEVKTRVEAQPPPAAIPLTSLPQKNNAPPQPPPRQQVVPMPPHQLPPPPPLANPPLARDRPQHRETLPREHPIPSREQVVNLPPPPPLPLPDKAEPPIVTLDDLFRKTKATPRIYYLPLSNEQVAEKAKARGKNVVNQ
ncbi:hypothetical protein OROGR_017319 [Orobanche gracilis]